VLAGKGKVSPSLTHPPSVRANQLKGDEPMTNITSRLTEDFAKTKIDSSSTDAWAKTWVAKFREEIPWYQIKSTVHDLLCDMVIGDLPWTEKENNEVFTKIPQQADFPDLLKEFKDAFNSDNLEILFQTDPNPLPYEINPTPAEMSMLVDELPSTEA